MEDKNTYFSLFNRDLDLTIEKIIKKYGLEEHYEEFKKTETYEHNNRLSHYAGVIAKELGFKESFIDRIYLLAPYHDFGKLLLEQSILLKPSKLTDNEYRHIQQHTVLGYKILRGHNEFLDEAALISLQHHEKWNGTGYPQNLKGEEIDINSRIISAVDVLDALLSKRVYKESWNYEKVKSYFIQESGKSFDPKISNVIVNNFDKFIKIFETMK